MTRRLITRRLITRRLVPLLLAGLLLAAAGLPASAQSGGDNTAVAVNTSDGHDVFRLAFSVRRTTSDVVDTTNAAVAFASCTDCQTVALAFQVVLILEDPDVVTPMNLALAYNYECTLCDTLASAYQIVLTTGGAVRFTPEGSQRLATIRQRLRGLRRAELSSVELQAQVDALYEELRQVVATQLVPAGPRSRPGGTPTTASRPTSTTAAPATSSTTGGGPSTTAASRASTTSTSAPAGATTTSTTASTTSSSSTTSSTTTSAP